MSTVKFKCDRDAFAKRLAAVIRGEINTFIADGGIHPTAIDVRVCKNLPGHPAVPEYVLTGVEVSFSL